MKTIKYLFLGILLFTVSQNTQAQIWKRLAKHAEEKVKREAERRAERRVDKGIDKTFDEAEDEIDGKNKHKKSSKKKKGKKAREQAEETGNETGSKAKNSKKNTENLVWSKFDFVPGDTVIFEDGPAVDEENGEFPSRWDLIKGNAEIVEVDGEPAIYIRERYSTIIPYLKNADKDYLPEVFTIEFDVHFSPKTYMYYRINLWDIKNQAEPANSKEARKLTLNIYPNGIESSMGDHKLPNKKGGISDNSDVYWRHISMAYTKGKFKVYMDDTRLINIPHFEVNPTGLTIEGDGNGNENEIRYLKNIRIAKGGVKYYKRVLSDGKIIVNGIKFDVNKATLKPESMGPINRIYKLMVKQPDLKFSVEGHTDSDGNDSFNMKLSKARAKTVMNKLIAMGIAKFRLKYTGYGESKPIDNNSTAEGKANNRRVEFIKF